MPSDTQAPPAGGWSAIEADAAALDAGQAAAPGAPAPIEADPQQLAQAASQQLVSMAAPLLLPLVALKWGKALADAYGPHQQAAIAAALAAVAVKRGWQLDGLVDTLPEVALCAALVGPALPFALAEAQRRQAEADGAPASRPAELPAPPGGSGFDAR